MRDIVKESPDFVRGCMEDTLLEEYTTECNYCNNPVVPRSACVSNCPNCGQEFHSCGD